MQGTRSRHPRAHGPRSRAIIRSDLIVSEHNLSDSLKQSLGQSVLLNPHSTDGNSPESVLRFGVIGSPDWSRRRAESHARVIQLYADASRLLASSDPDEVAAGQRSLKLAGELWAEHVAQYIRQANSPDPSLPSQPLDSGGESSA